MMLVVSHKLVGFAVLILIAIPVQVLVAVRAPCGIQRMAAAFASRIMVETPVVEGSAAGEAAFHALQLGAPARLGAVPDCPAMAATMFACNAIRLLIRK